MEWSARSVASAGGRRPPPRRPPTISACLGLGAIGLAAASAGAQEITPLLRAQHGAPVKLIVREPTGVFEGPTTSSGSRPAALFDFFYAYQPPTAPGSRARGETRDGFYYIGQAAPKGEPIGWIPSEKVVRWPHRQALGFRPQAGRRRALFFAGAEDLAAAYRPGNESRARSMAISEEPAAPGGVVRAALLPILDEDEVILGGDRARIYRVAYLHKSAEVPQVVPPRDITLDVAFVIDATGSMQKWIDETLAAVTSLSRELATLPELKDKVRLGLVCFRDGKADYLPDDYVPPDDYVVRKYCDLDQGANHGLFLDALHTVRAEGGGQTPERVLDGLDAAIREFAWSRRAYKHVILIGNASTHLDPARSGGLRIDQVLREAQPEGAGDDPARAITIHAIRVPTKDPADPDGPVCAGQFRQLARGVRYPGVYQEQDQLGRFSRDLLALIRGRLRYIAQLARGEAAEDVIASARGDRLIGPLLPMLEAGRSRTGLVTGFVAENDVDGRSQVEPYLLVRQDQLRTFGAFLSLFLNVLQGAGDPGSRDVNRVVASLQEQVALLNLGESVDRNTPTREVLRWVLDAPVRDPVFDITPQVLATMPAEKFDAWQRDVRDIRDRIERLLDDRSRWVHLGRETKAERMHAFIRMVDLP